MVKPYCSNFRVITANFSGIPIFRRFTVMPDFLTGLGVPVKYFIDFGWQHFTWYYNLSRLMTKPTKWHVRPAKTQISLGICPVWSESSPCAQWVAKDPSFLHADSEDSDQTGWMPRLILVYTGRTCHFVGFDMTAHLVSHLDLCFISDLKKKNNIIVFMLIMSGFRGVWCRYGLPCIEITNFEVKSNFIIV